MGIAKRLMDHTRKLELGGQIDDTVLAKWSSRGLAPAQVTPSTPQTGRDLQVHGRELIQEPPVRRKNQRDASGPASRLSGTRRRRSRYAARPRERSRAMKPQRQRAHKCEDGAPGSSSIERCRPRCNARPRQGLGSDAVPCRRRPANMQNIQKQYGRESRNDA